MKYIVLVCSIGLFSLPLVSSAISDDFNDNTQDTNMWTTASTVGSIVEQNQRLEYSAPAPTGGSGDDNDAEWMFNHQADYDEDWNASLTVGTTLSTGSFADGDIASMSLFLVNNDDPNNDYLELGLATGRDDSNFGGAFRATYADLSEGGNSIDLVTSSITNTVTDIRMSWNANAESLLLEYNEGAGWTTLTNVALNAGAMDWGMNSNSTFSLSIDGYNEQLAVNNGDIYADNFEAIPEPSVLVTMLFSGLLIFFVRRNLCQ